MIRPPRLLVSTMLLVTLYSSVVSAQRGGRRPFDLPATFKGTTPCADCPGIEVTLTLYPDGTFFSRDKYLERGPARIDLGKWTFDAQRGQIVLRGGTEGPRIFAVRGATTIRMLDTQGREIQSKLNYDLARTATVEPIRDSTRWRGMYLYMADAAVLTECLTGKKFSVRGGPAAAALEREYLKVRKKPGEPVFVTFEGRLEPKGAGEEGPADILVVDKVDKTSPGEACEEMKAPASIASTTWKLVDLGGTKVTVAQGREPYISFNDKEKAIIGFAGCNRFRGNYERSGETLRLSKVIATRMACREGMQLETEFLGALEGVSSYQMEGTMLTLFSNEKPVAKFEPTGPR